MIFTKICFRLFILIFAFILNSINCFSQLIYKDTTSADSKVKSIIGQDAKDWILTSGKFDKLTDLKGKIVLLEFSSTNCGVCRIAEKAMISIDSTFKNDKLVIVQIISNSEDRTHAQIKFIEDVKLSRINFVDYTDISKKYFVKAAPTFFLINKAGIITYAQVGYSQDISKKTMIDEISKIKNN